MSFNHYQGKSGTEIGDRPQFPQLTWTKKNLVTGHGFSVCRYRANRGLSLFTRIDFKEFNARASSF